VTKKAFKSESKRLLELMVHSIYTHKEIFLRELISNASDAMDKLYYKTLSDENLSFNRDNFFIRIDADSKARTLTITDTGIGMTKEELEENLGTIAKSGSLQFKKDNETPADVDIIGQFGVGFYSAFMVADKVTVTSRALGSEEACCWEAEDTEGYTISPAEKETVGTQIVLHLKPNTEDDSYDEFLDEYRIRGIIKKYSDYIRYPIQMMVTKTRPKADNEQEFEDYQELETLNSMVPIWKKTKAELTDEDYNNFYKDKFFDFQNPLSVIHTSADGVTSYTALLYIPAHAPYDFYTKDFEKGLQLYANGVLIMDACAELLPDCFRFVKGLVDSADLSLNISRELLQHDRQLKVIAAHLQKKIKNELLSMLKNKRETYETFYQNFSRQLKFGIYDNFGRDKELLQDLLLYYSSTEKKLVTLDEYVSRMKEDQKHIYYACGETVDKINKLPQTELLTEKGCEILYFTEDVDEFVIQMLQGYADKEFKSVAAGDLNLESEDEKKELEKKKAENKDLFLFMQDALGDKVKEVRASTRLKSHPVCLTSEGMLSIEMEKVLNSMPNNQKVKAERVLEININHPIFATIAPLYDTDKEKLKQYASVLYDSALLIEGLPIEDPVAYTNAICELMR